MKRNLPILAALLMSLVATAPGQRPVPPIAPTAAPQAKSDATAELKAIGTPYFAAVETVSSDYQKWVTATEAWYVGELDKLQNARSKLGDLDGALAIKAERTRSASHTPTLPEEIQAMPPVLRALRTTFDQGMKRNMDEGTRRIEVARRRYLADLEALQKRITITGDIEQAVIVKTEKERFIAEMTAGPGTPVSLPPPAKLPAPPPASPVAINTPKPSPMIGTIRNGPAPSPNVGTIRNGPPAATPVAATRERPFANTLGMEFVPVPGTTVLFCRWQTRVKDYAEYAKTKNVPPLWKMAQQDGIPVGREPDHPACSMFWNDAKDFCRWLTEKENASGKLPKGMKYRLPTDEEWSRAVGLPKEEGATPRERNGRNQTDFPWGTEWPPKAKAGNYADETFHREFPDPMKKWIEGYTDGFATTAPVGSFPPNQFGIHDLGSNVGEWCEDTMDPEQTLHVSRGTSWANSARFLLLSSHRWNLSSPNSSSPNIGFRCVVETSAQ